ncbi:S53 family peptidase [Aspergillus affinis]|uniref:S53 family peptidase n=1 Tax=Aspergillus affinis TaxID=1070780 RepID=UPI0022FE0E7E|nr:subtilisin-like protein [Aspergillus affinis]KAI9045526.1 subtilisin-like protein [Aspergillus affinis]
MNRGIAPPSGITNKQQLHLVAAQPRHATAKILTEFLGFVDRHVVEIHLFFMFFSQRPVDFLVSRGTLSLVLFCLYLVVAADSGYAVVERLSDAPDGWIKGSAPPPYQQMRFHLALHQEKASEFEQRVVDLSTPSHPSYGQHMKREDIKDFVRPSAGALDPVLFWLASKDVPSETLDIHGNWITFTVPLYQAEVLLKTRFYNFYNRVTGAMVIRTLEYSVPEEIYPFVQLVQPTTRFGRLVSQAEMPQFKPTAATFEELSANCSSRITPDCLRELYGLYDTEAEPDPRNRLGVSGFLDQYARHGDFHDFIGLYAPNRTDTNFTVVSINGGLNLQNSSRSSSEASLDIQYAAALAHDSLTTYYTTGGRGPAVPNVGESNDSESTNEPYLEQLHFLLNLPDEELPAVLTTSYGEDEQTVPASYSNATCNLFAQLGARGVSVIFSSGDSGTGEFCITNEGTNTTRFQPTFPASCPFVTSVGGTYGIKPEKAIGFSGGGFSERFARPKYQDESVGHYLEELGDRWDGLYNHDGRGIPDVAAQAANFLVVDQGNIIKIGGTSASAPVFAAIISRLNAVRLEDEKPRLGFLNPWLYSLNQTGFTDIIDEGSVGCRSGPGPEVPYASWNATEGWDPVTGLGTPFYNTLAKVVKAI